MFVPAVYVLAGFPSIKEVGAPTRPTVPLEPRLWQRRTFRFCSVHAAAGHFKYTVSGRFVKRIFRVFGCWVT